MLAYAFGALKDIGCRDLGSETFENMGDLCAAILIDGVNRQLKQGLGREYVPTTESIPTLRGKINITETISSNLLSKQMLVCTYDEFTENSMMNRIIKTTLLILLRSDIAIKRKKLIRKLLVFFSNVEILNVYSINWNIQYNRTNKTYRLLMFVCHLVLKELLQTESHAKGKLKHFLDEGKEALLFERFVFEFYRKEMQIYTVSAPHVSWKVDDNYNALLPRMETDIVLTAGKKNLIIDTKYYSKNTQRQWDKVSLHSSNLYQIFAYVKNWDANTQDTSQPAAGMLLYAKTDEEIQPNNTYQMSGNTIMVRNVDLMGDFSTIAQQLKDMVNDYFLQSKVKIGCFEHKGIIHV